MAPLASPFSSRPLSAWIEDLQHSDADAIRYRALLAVNSMAMPAEAARWLRHSLKDVDSGVRAQAAKQLGEMKRRNVREDEVPWSEIGLELAERLNDEDPDVRFEAARALGQVNPPATAALDVLLSFLDDGETQPLMTAVVVSALGERSDLIPEQMVGRCRKLLAHTQPEIRENSSALIAKSSVLAASLSTELVVAIEDDEPIVRENAAIALGHGGVRTSAVFEALTIATRDEDEGVAVTAQSSLARLSN